MKKCIIFSVATVWLIISSATIFSSCAQKTVNKELKSVDDERFDQYDRYIAGDLKGFIKLPDEQFSYEIEKPFYVREVSGLCLHGHYSEEKVPLAGVIVELRGPDSEMRVISTESDKDGNFQFKYLPDGAYRMKTSYYAFQPILGRVIVSKTADCSKIVLKLLVDD